jgi:hypothetical protein
LNDWNTLSDLNPRNMVIWVPVRNRLSVTAFDMADGDLIRHWNAQSRLRSVDYKRRTAQWLLQKEPWNLAIVGFCEGHPAGRYPIEHWDYSGIV